MATLRIGPTTELRILAETPEAFLVEAAYADGGGPPPGHLHPAQDEAFEILEENRDVLDTLVLELFDKETLDKQQVARIFEPLRRRPERPAWTGSDRRIPSAIPPVEIPQWIKDRTAANYAAFAASNGDGPKADDEGESEGGTILTPPGSGGKTGPVAERPLSAP